MVLWKRKLKINSESNTVFGKSKLCFRILLTFNHNLKFDDVENDYRKRLMPKIIKFKIYFFLLL